MKSASFSLLAAAMLCAPLGAFADPHKHEHGHGKHKHGRHNYKEEYWDGPCKVERKWKKNGEYKEERKCKDLGRVYYAPQSAYVPAPVYVPAPEPGIVIQGTVRIP